MTYEYGVMSSKYSLQAEDKLIAYCAMVVHYSNSPHLVVIYSPEEAKEDAWTSFTGQSATILDKVFGGAGAWEKFLSENVEAVKACMKTIKKLV
jgi:hypothetical protein